MGRLTVIQSIFLVTSQHEGELLIILVAANREKHSRWLHYIFHNTLDLTSCEGMEQLQA